MRKQKCIVDFCDAFVLRKNHFFIKLSIGVEEPFALRHLFFGCHLARKKVKDLDGVYQILVGRQFKNVFSVLIDPFFFEKLSENDVCSHHIYDLGRW